MDKVSNVHFLTHGDIVCLSAQADEVFRLSETVSEMKNVALSESKRRIWVHAPRPEYQRQTQRYNLPVRILSLVRKKKDIIILQGNHEPTREYWDFCKEVLELDDDQAIFTEGEIFNRENRFFFLHFSCNCCINLYHEEALKLVS